MIDNQQHYKSLQTTDLVELLAEVTRRFSQALSTEESERTLDSYRELMGVLQREIQLRSAAGAVPNSSQGGNVLPVIT